MAVLALGCAGPAPLVFNPKYRNADLVGRVVHVLPSVDVRVQNLDDFRDDFKGEGVGDSLPGAVLDRLFNRNFADYADNVTLAFDSTWDAAGLRYWDIHLPLPGKNSSLDSDFPMAPDGLFRAKGFEPDMALQISHLRFKRAGRSTPAEMVPTFISTPEGTVVTGVVTVGGEREYLALDGSFLLWDYNANEAVSYGRFRSTSAFVSAMSKQDWEKVISQSVLCIIKNSPLKGPKYAAAVTYTTTVTYKTMMPNKSREPIGVGF